MIGQLALFRQGGPAFGNSRWPRIAGRWSQTAQVRQIGWKANQPFPEFLISVSCEFGDSHPHDSPFDKPGRVQIQTQYQPSRGSIDTPDSSIRHRSYSRPTHNNKWIIDFLVQLNAIAAPTCIDEVCVFRSNVGEQPLRLKMIDIKFTGDMAPLFPLQAVNASKSEFITQPWAIRSITSITTGAVASVTAGIRIIEYQLGVRSESSMPSKCRCNRLAPSSGTISSVSQ